MSVLDGCFFSVGGGGGESFDGAMGSGLYLVCWLVAYLHHYQQTNLITNDLFPCLII